MLGSARRAVTATLFVALSASAADDFERRVRPLLTQRCVKCHGPAKSAGGLRLDSKAALLRGGDTGPAATIAKPESSLLLQAVDYAGDLRMPPDGKLNPDEVAVLRAWALRGFPWPESARIVSEDTRRQWWAWRPARAVEPPTVEAASPIDRFVVAKLAAKGLTLAPPANKRTLLRRATYDLVGLPPSPEEMDAFLADRSPTAFHTVVERLLASRQYGERWGRHWLDLARYADTAGENSDHPVADAWRYRNWVIDAFNADLPYDEFVRLQVAGDLLPADVPPAARAAGVVATGFLALARRFDHDIDKHMHLTHEDALDTLGRSVLGLSLACARCHDHKFDPISADDYTALTGILQSSRFPFPGCEPSPKPRDLVPLPAAGPGATAYALTEGISADARTQRRGDPEKLGPTVPRRWLELFGGQPLPTGAGSGRRQLAAWLTDPNNPLPARVMANRVWQHHFGKGLVATPNDFGTRGAVPTHPELLDWLAGRLVADRWSIKSLHRQIMRSATYQQANVANPAAALVDPANDLRWRFDRRRLSAEELRDTLLVVGGNLDRTPGGPHPFPPVSAWGFTQHNPFAATYDTERRSVYLMVARNRRHPFLGLFDGADPNATTAVRQTTTVPTQALYFMNDPFVHAQADRLAARALAKPDDAARLGELFRLAYQRPPSDRERSLAAGFLRDYMARLADVKSDDRPKRAWAAFARVALAGNELLYLE